MQDSMSLINTAAGFLVLAFLAHKYWQSVKSPLNNIPTVGPSDIIGSYLCAYKFNRNAREIIQEGYTKYRGRIFKVATMARWVVIASGPHMIDDIRKATDDQLSMREAIQETLQTDYMLGHDISRDPYHIATVRTPLTRNLGARFSDIKDEIASAFSDLIPATETNWVKVPVFKTLRRVACRTSNRLFVGLPLCRNSDFLKLNEQFAVNVADGSRLLGPFPLLLKPWVARFYSTVSTSIRRAMVHLGPIIEDRLLKEQQYGKDYPGKPNDLISWLLEDAQGYQRTVRDITRRVLVVNFAAIHTTSMALSHILFDLAIHPEYVQAMREEVEAVISHEGWSKASMGRMRKLDSFIKEVQRLEGSPGARLFLMNRIVLKDFTFSDGTLVPAGTMIGVPVWATHHDESIYQNAETFDGFRFAEMRDHDGEGIKHQMVSLGLDYVVFGHGRHACPGRFFAVNELKAMLAYILLNYDVKLAVEGPRPSNFWSGTSSSPNPMAEMMFRKRSA